MSVWAMCLRGHLWVCWSYPGADLLKLCRSHKTICENLAILNWPLLEMSLWTMCLPGHIWLCWSYAGAPASHKTVPRTTNWRYINMLCSESFHMASSAAPVTALVKPQNLKLRLCIWQQGSLFLILSYPGLFKNIPHVWFLRLYSFLKNPQYDFPKMRWGGSKAVWNFSKNSSVLVRTCFPYKHFKLR